MLVEDGATTVRRVTIRWITTPARLLSNSCNYSIRDWQPILTRNGLNGIENGRDNLLLTLCTILMQMVGFSRGTELAHNQY